MQESQSNLEHFQCAVDFDQLQQIRHLPTLLFTFIQHNRKIKCQPGHQIFAFFVILRNNFLLSRKNRKYFFFSLTQQLSLDAGNCFFKQSPQNLYKQVMSHCQGMCGSFLSKLPCIFLACELCSRKVAMVSMQLFAF